MLIGLIIVFIYSLYNYNSICINIIESSKIWFYNIMPGIFIINIFIDLILSRNLSFIKILYKPFNKIFKINSIYSIIIIIISPFIGNPGAYRIINNYYNDNKISKNEAIKLLQFNNYINPLFIISIVSLIISFKASIIIIISSILSNLLYGIIFNKNNDFIDEEYINKSLLKTLNDSLKSIINMLLSIWASIVFFGILIELLNKVPSYFLGLIEISNGLLNLKINNSNLSMLYIGIIIGFNGLSIIIQEYLLINENFKMKDFLTSRITISLLTGIFSYLGGLYVL